MERNHISLVVVILLLNISIIAPSIMGATPETQTSKTYQAKTTSGSYYAVIAACTRYENKTHDVPHFIPYSDRALSRTYNMLLQTKNWQPDHITLLLNENGTKANIVNALHNMAATLGPNDYFLFQWCGHGTSVNVTDQNGNKTRHVAICPYDVEKYSNDSYTNMITDDELDGLFSNITCKGMVLIFDCCLSGSLVNSTNETKQALTELTFWKARGPDPLGVDGPNRIVIMATPPDCLELGTHHGFPLNNALGTAGKLAIALHLHGSTISAEQLYRDAQPVFYAEMTGFWISMWIYSYEMESIIHPHLRYHPIILSIFNTIGFIEAIWIVHHMPIDGYIAMNQMNISDEYPGDLPLLIK